MAAAFDIAATQCAAGYKEFVCIIDEAGSAASKQPTDLVRALTFQAARAKKGEVVGTFRAHPADGTVPLEGSVHKLLDLKRGCHHYHCARPMPQVLSHSETCEPDGSGLLKFEFCMAVLAAAALAVVRWRAQRLASLAGLNGR